MEVERPGLSMDKLPVGFVDAPQDLRSGSLRGCCGGRRKQFLRSGGWGRRYSGMAILCHGYFDKMFAIPQIWDRKPGGSRGYLSISTQRHSCLSKNLLECKKTGKLLGAEKPAGPPRARRTLGGIGRCGVGPGPFLQVPSPGVNRRGLSSQVALALGIPALSRLATPRAFWSCSLTLESGSLDKCWHWWARPGTTEGPAGWAGSFWKNRLAVR